MSALFTTRRWFAAALLGAAPAQLHAATPPVETTAQTIILRPVTVLKIADLDFGAITVTTAGTILLDPVDDSIATTGGVIAVAGTPHAARFVGAASGSSVVNIKLKNQPVTLTRVGGTQTMTLTKLTLDSPDKRTMAQAGSFEFKVGGTVNVGANQAEGTYLGTFTVTVQYP